MLISNLRILPIAVCLGLAVTTAHAFDGRKSPDNSVPEIPGVGPVAKPPSAQSNNCVPEGPGAGAGGCVPSFALPTMGHESAGMVSAVKVLEAASEKGDIIAAWKLGRMYAEGLGVERSAAHAVGYFLTVVESKDNDQVPELRPVIADASVHLGLYYLKGVPYSDIKVDPIRAHKMFFYAASILGDADAQYYLGRMYLDGQGIAREPKLAEKWLYHAATRGQWEAQVKYGSMLIEGKVVPRDVAKGLMWLHIAMETAPEGDARESVRRIYNLAVPQATDTERADADVYYEKSKVGKAVARQ